VLQDPESRNALAPFVVTEVDVDRSESWALKSRYRVGAYPTVVVARPDGEEVARIEGYPGEAAFLAWLAGAVQGPDEVERRMAAIEGEADVAWLLEHGRDRVGRWFWDLEVDLSPQTVAALRDALGDALLAAEGAEAADLLQALAELSPPEQRATLLLAAASAMQGALTGDPELDRGYYVPLADLYEDAGHPDLALDLLRQAASRYPHEFTYHFAVAGLLLRQGQASEALPSALAAEALAYGDQELRAAMRHAEVLVALGRKDEAKAVLEAALQGAARPEAGVEVRTTRYLAELEAMVGGL
jgi:hypothetical protein